MVPSGLLASHDYIMPTSHCIGLCVKPLFEKNNIIKNLCMFWNLCWLRHYEFFKNMQIFILVGGENPELVVLVLELQMVSLWHSNLKI